MFLRECLNITQPKLKFFKKKLNCMLKVVINNGTNKSGDKNKCCLSEGVVLEFIQIFMECRIARALVAREGLYPSTFSSPPPLLFCLVRLLLTAYVPG